MDLTTLLNKLDIEKDNIVQEVRTLIDNKIALGEFDIEEIRLMKKSKKCRYVRKKYVRNGKEIIVLKRKCD